MNMSPEAGALDRRIGQRLKGLRVERGWSLEELSGLSGVSRSTLSRLENAEVSPTAGALGKLCAAFGLPMSRLMRMVEEEFLPLLARRDQPVWTDAGIGFIRRSVSPPARTLAGEAVECALAAGARIDYERPPLEGLEHHLVMLEGQLCVSVGGRDHRLGPGDCLRYQLSGPSAFETPPDSGARYLLFIV